MGRGPVDFWDSPYNTVSNVVYIPSAFPTLCEILTRRLREREDRDTCGGAWVLHRISSGVKRREQDTVSLAEITVYSENTG